MPINPAELLYSDTHEWLRVEGQEAVVGITRFAQDALGDITYVELPDIGSAFQAGQTFGSVESVKAASDLVAPANGTVTAVNTALEDAPELLNTSPYGKGWLARIELTAKPDTLMDAAGYDVFCATEK
ncbi:MAG: glycine cleavage system protein GcvH [Desulfovibrio sp.]|jgi:glycine cleavage system H protein|nr:glycine cleavage system protein GcvH [Desulfovibrio sp.]